jgi:hypothetical protein
MAKRATKTTKIRPTAHAVSLRLHEPLYSKVADASKTLQISVTSVLRLAVDRGLDQVMTQLAK